MEIVETKQGDVVVLALTGRLDTLTSKALDERCSTLLETGERRLVLDASGLEYVNSSGLRALLLLARRLKDVAGVMAVSGLNVRNQNIFDMTGFSNILSIYLSVDEAVRNLRLP